jgi:hypothetical protein
MLFHSVNYDSKNITAVLCLCVCLLPLPPVAFQPNSGLGDLSIKVYESHTIRHTHTL